LVLHVFQGGAVVPGPFLVMDDTYRPKRRRLHDTQPSKGGGREPYSRGTVVGLFRCFVVIDLKVGPFKPEYAGRMNFYLVRCG
jgi:hypothetical protein